METNGEIIYNIIVLVSVLSTFCKDNVKTILIIVDVFLVPSSIQNIIVKWLHFISYITLNEPVMIIHLWMHWFWITSQAFKGSVFVIVQMISFSSIPQSLGAEAGLRLDKIIISHSSNLNEKTNSSQIDTKLNITPVIIEKNQKPNRPIQVSSTTNQYEEIKTHHGLLNSTSKNENSLKVSSESMNDMGDLYNGGSVDFFQYPLKKYTKHSRTKFGKAKVKGKPNEDSGEEEKKLESLKIIEDNLNVNLSIGGSSSDRIGPEVDSLSGALEWKNSSETVDLLTTTTKNYVSVDFNETESSTNVGLLSSTEEIVLKDEPPKKENVIFPSTIIPDVFLNSTGDQKDLFSKNDTFVIENKVEESRTYTTVETFLEKNRVAAATSTQNFDVEKNGLNAGSITGITLGILVIFSLFGAVSFVIYRRRYLNKPQVFHDKCSNLDSSGYIDDTSLRENLEEMYSLDNDSFLNSLEAMTIQNYWTENVKHTKL